MAVKFYLLGIERQMDQLQTQENQVYDIALWDTSNPTWQNSLFLGNFDYKVTLCHILTKMCYIVVNSTKQPAFLVMEV